MTTDSSQILIAWQDNRKMGELTLSKKNWSFRYFEHWLEFPEAYPLCPSIPLSKEIQRDTESHPVIQWFFYNLLVGDLHDPLRSGAVDTPDSFSQSIRDKKELLGALRLLPPKTELPPENFLKLSTEELFERLKNCGNSKSDLRLIHHRKQFIEPLGSSLSNINLKSPVTKHPTSAGNEWFVSKLARKMGLIAPELSLSYLPEPVLVVTRHDRTGKHPHIRSIPMISGSQLCGLDPVASPIETAFSLLKVIDFVHKKATTRIQIFRWILFSTLIGNGKANLKQLYFVVSKRGYDLAAITELMSTIVGEANPILESPLPIPIGKAKTFNQLTKNDIMRFADQLGLPEKLANKELDKMVAGILPAFKKLYEETKRGPDQPSKKENLQLLKEVQYEVFFPMVRKLAK